MAENLGRRLRCSRPRLTIAEGKTYLTSQLAGNAHRLAISRVSIYKDGRRQTWPTEGEKHDTGSGLRDDAGAANRQAVVVYAQSQYGVHVQGLMSAQARTRGQSLLVPLMLKS